MTLHEWLDANYAKLLTYAKYQCRGDQEQAQDLVQEMITQVLEGRVKVDLSRSPLTYLQFTLRTIRSRNLYGPARVRQTEGKSVVYGDQFVLAGDEWLTAQVEQPMEEGYEFYPLFKQLPLKLRPVMELYLEGLSHREIGARLGRPHQTVQGQLQKGIALLKVLVHGEAGG